MESVSDSRLFIIAFIVNDLNKIYDVAEDLVVRVSALQLLDPGLDNW